jgi:FKBP-type peptidyl-prolyl cis-trans isomerase
MFRRTASRALLAVALSVSLTACGEANGDSNSSASTTSAAGPTAQPCETRPATVQPEGISTDLAQKPEVPASAAPPPCDLVIGDVVVGTGAEAVAGTTAGIQYVGAFYESGEEFDSSWNGAAAGEPLPVPVGAGRVIPGFEQAITGMKVGGRRIVTIPSDLGYGDQDYGPIPGGSTLVFVLDLVQVT